MFAHDVHLTLAWATVVAMVAVALEASARVARGGRPGRLAEIGPSLTLVLIGMSAAAGLTLLIQSQRPRESLHYLYAVLALGVIPFADSFARHGSLRTKGLARLLGALVALGVIARLFSTG